MYYVYAHTKPSGEIFYIGKGTKRRVYSVSNRNRHWNFIVRKHSFKPTILAEFEDEKQALNEEILLISHFRKFGKLVNITDGGESNPMSNPEVAKQVAETKRAKGQYENNWKQWNDCFREKMKDFEFSQAIKEKRLFAQKKSAEIRHQTMLKNGKEVLLLRAKGLKYTDIQQKLNVSIGFISKVMNSGEMYA